MLWLRSKLLIPTLITEAIGASAFFDHRKTYHMIKTKKKFLREVDNVVRVHSKNVILFSVMSSFLHRF